MVTFLNSAKPLDAFGQCTADPCSTRQKLSLGLYETLMTTWNSFKISYDSIWEPENNGIGRRYYSDYVRVFNVVTKWIVLLDTY